MTFSLVAVSQSKRYVAAATASCSLAVGNAVPAVSPGVGAVVTQAYTNTSFRHLALDRARRGMPPGQVLKELNGLDDEFAKRQVAVVTCEGTTAAHTGQGCSPWAGAVEGDGFVVLGNLLAGPNVIEAMAEPLRQSQENPPAADFARTVMSAMLAGQEAGGDLRGQQSAALTIADNNALDTAPPELLIDLRVDDAPEPLVQLENLLTLWLADHKLALRT